MLDGNPRGRARVRVDGDLDPVEGERRGPVLDVDRAAHGPLRPYGHRARVLRGLGLRGEPTCHRAGAAPTVRRQGPRRADPFLSVRRPRCFGDRDGPGLYPFPCDARTTAIMLDDRALEGPCPATSAYVCRTGTGMGSPNEPRAGGRR